MKKVRDVFLEFVSGLAETTLPFDDIICDFFERMYNTLTTIKGLDSDISNVQETDFDIYKIHIWELFICVTVYLRHTQNYTMIHNIITNTYFLTYSCWNNDLKPTNYCKFRCYSRLVEEQYKPTTIHKNEFSLLGYALCKEREKKPIYTGEAIAEADFFYTKSQRLINSPKAISNTMVRNGFLCVIYMCKKD